MKDSSFDKLCAYLKEMFQFDENDLDFGVFRVLKLKRGEIEAFIDGDGKNDLNGVVKRTLDGIRVNLQALELAEVAKFVDEKGIAEEKQLFLDFQADPDAEVKQKLVEFIEYRTRDDGETRSRLVGALESILAGKMAHNPLEDKIYNHILSFFGMYYSNGDFGYNTRSLDTFKVEYDEDYNGSDVMFHWKHRDSYYVKTATSFNAVPFVLRDQRLEFRLEQAADGTQAATAQNNNKDTALKHYLLDRVDLDVASDTWQVVFHLAASSTPKAVVYTRIYETVFGGGDPIQPYLTRRPDRSGEAKPAFNDLASDNFDETSGGAVKGVGQLRLSQTELAKRLADKPEFAALGSNNDKRQATLLDDALFNELYTLDRNLNKFLVGQDADYFIHKDLKGFLRRERDKYVKNIIFCDLERLLDLEIDNTTVVLAKAFHAVTERIIDFLDAFESFQRNLFTMKKKVVRTDWLVSVGRIPPELHPDIVANPAQLAEFADEYGVEVKTVADLAKHPTLVVDTRHFRDGGFVDRLLAPFDNLDEQTDGLLIESENFQALNLLQEKYRGRVKCIYIDPPYNTGGDGFLYKDSFRHSSWLTMMENRVGTAAGLLNPKGVLFASIDATEQWKLQAVLELTFGRENRVEELIWVQNTTKNQSPTYSTNHEYIPVYARDLGLAKADYSMFREPKPGLSQIQSLLERLNPNYPSVDEIEDALRSLFREHRRRVKATEERTVDEWSGIYNYNRAEYRDSDGRLVDESEAESRQAEIWVWREVDVSMPQVKADSQKPAFRDQGEPEYRFYRPIHPITGKPCPAPKRGWSWPYERCGKQTYCFRELVEDARIAFGVDETKIPQRKSFLHEVETNVAKSIVRDFTDGEAELRDVFGRNRTFSNPKPTTLVQRIASQTTQPGDTVLDFFAGSGTTGHAVIRLNKEGPSACDAQAGWENRKFILVEMGEYFEPVLKRRIRKVMYSLNWQDGKPVAEQVDGWQGLVKVQRLEQYEDILDALEPAALPEGATPASQIPLKYLYRPEQNALLSTLDLANPFGNRIRYGRLREETPVDLLETYLYLRGYRVRTRRVHERDGRRYVAVETTTKQLILWRDLGDGGDGDDTTTLRAIAGEYADLEGVEVNHTCDLRKMPANTVLVGPDEFDRGAEWG